MPGYYKMLIHIFYRMQNVKNTIFHNLIKFSDDWLSPSGDSELYWKINLLIRKIIEHKSGKNTNLTYSYRFCM